MDDTTATGLRCPRCGKQGDLKVVNSRPRGNAIARRRECEFCGARFTTMELTDERNDVERIKEARDAVRDAVDIYLREINR
jgi:transcriptional regulator NrdR family protein